jgi:hypothetical protein
VENDRGSRALAGECSFPWKWCHYAPGKEPHTLAERPQLASRLPIAASSCCCDTFDGTGETFSVLDAARCAKTSDAHCVISDFCGDDGQQGRKRLARRLSRATS